MNEPLVKDGCIVLTIRAREYMTPEQLNFFCYLLRATEEDAIQELCRLCEELHYECVMRELSPITKVALKYGVTDAMCALILCQYVQQFGF